MFLKPFRVKNKSAMKGSDRKKLRQDIQEQFPSLSSADAADLIPNKGEMTIVKIVLHTDEVFQVFCDQKNPVFCEYFKKLYPSVYTTWKFPNMLPVFTTYGPVFQKLLNGADLMLPGVEVNEEPHPKMFGNLQKGDHCLVRLKGNKAPMALAEALMSGEDMYASAMKGKGFHMVHLFGDHLWEMGDKSQPPQIQEMDDGDNSDISDTDGEPAPGTEEAREAMDQLHVAGESDTGATASAECLEHGTASLDKDGDDDGDDNEEDDKLQAAGGDCSETAGPVDMDSLFRHCFKCAIKGRIRNGDLPLLTSKLLNGYMQPFCPAGKRLDVKKSSYKKFSNFLKEMERDRFIEIKEISKGVDAITSTDRSHADLRGFTVPDVIEEAANGAEEEDAFEPPEIKEVLSVTAAVLPLLSPKGYSKGSLLSAPEVRELITEYVKSENLQEEDNRRLVKLDPILASLALTRDEGDTSHLSWDTLFTRIIGKLQPGRVITMKGREPVLRKDHLHPIKVDVEQRASKKKVTIVENLDAFGINPQQFADLTQKKVASGITVSQSEKKNYGPEVHIQGNQAKLIVKQLLDVYRIPQKYVHTTERASKAKR